MSSQLELSPIARDVLEQEVARIVALGGEWKPTFDNLAAVIVRAQEAEGTFIYERQGKGYERARAAGKKIGRSAIKKPKRFAEIRKRFLAGRLTANEAAAILDVSLVTFRKWCKELDQDGSLASKRPRVERSTASDQRRLLAFFRNTAPSPRGNSVVTLEEIVVALGWSMDKVLQVRSDLLETERLKVVTCRNKDMQLVPGYHITKLGLRYMSNQKPAPSASKKTLTSFQNELSHIAIETAVEQDPGELQEHTPRTRAASKG